MLIYYPSQETHSLNKYWLSIRYCILDVGMQIDVSRISMTQSKMGSWQMMRRALSSCMWLYTRCTLGFFLKLHCPFQRIHNSVRRSCFEGPQLCKTAKAHLPNLLSSWWDKSSRPVPLSTTFAAIACFASGPFSASPSFSNFYSWAPEPSPW